MGTRVLLVCAIVILGPVSANAAAELVSYAIVQEDASLLVRGKTVRLFGTFVPESARVCRDDFSPPLCGSRAANALALKIQGFVRCQPQAELEDGSLSAICHVSGNSILDAPVDLGAWLIQQGWAVATPDAPFEYQVYERIAREQGRGVWGVPVDRIIR
jgi:endonuclease YncB( thermonuclease family)